MNDTAKVRVLGPDEGASLAVVGEHIRLKLTTRETQGSCAVWTEIVPPAGGPPPHVHQTEDELFIVLEGHVAFWSEHGTTIATAGAVVFGPRGVPHTFKNTGATSARMVVVATPGGFEDFLREASSPAGQPPTFPPSADDIQRAMAAAPRHGLEFLPSPVS